MSERYDDVSSYDLIRDMANRDSHVRMKAIVTCTRAARRAERAGDSGSEAQVRIVYLCGRNGRGFMFPGKPKIQTLELRLAGKTTKHASRGVVLCTGVLFGGRTPASAHGSCCGAFHPGKTRRNGQCTELFQCFQRSQLFRVVVPGFFGKSMNVRYLD